MKPSMPQADFAIVVVAYNRLQSLSRLIESLLNANYLGAHVDLVVSIDCSGNDLVGNFADKIGWPFGEKRVIRHGQRLGLKKHVLSCGELTKEYKNICVFEDDLYASPGFYSFAVAATRHYEEVDEIAGISLYNHLWNPYVDRPFHALLDDHDVYHMKIASSWGQVWTRKGWQGFSEWLNDKTDDDLRTNKLPVQVAEWSSKSWLKFFNGYLAQTGRYFVYPSQSLATNFSDFGEHARGSSTYQVPLLMGCRSDYRFPIKKEDAIKYDAFFEPEGLAEKLGLDPEDVNISFYGNKVQDKRYLISSENLPYKLIKSFGLKLRPWEVNILKNIKGDGIYLYDTSISEKKRRKIGSRIERFMYEVRTSSRFEMLATSGLLYWRSIQRKLTGFYEKFG